MNYAVRLANKGMDISEYQKEKPRPWLERLEDILNAMQRLFEKPDKPEYALPISTPSTSSPTSISAAPTNNTNTNNNGNEKRQLWVDNWIQGNML